MLKATSSPLFLVIPALNPRFRKPVVAEPRRLLISKTGSRNLVGPGTRPGQGEMVPNVDLRFYRLFMAIVKPGVRGVQRWALSTGAKLRSEPF